MRADQSDVESAGSDDAPRKLQEFVEEQAFGRDIPVDDLISSVVEGERSEEVVAAARCLVQAFVEDGILEQLSDDLFRRVPPVPEHAHLPRRGNRLGSMRQDGRAGVRAAQVQGGFVKEKPRQRHGVGNKEELEEKFSKYFQELVSTWNPCYSKDGVCRFDWDAELAAHDVEIDAGASLDLPLEGDGFHRWPERVRLSKVLTATFWKKDGKTEREEIDVQPLRRLVAALVQTSARHDIHGKEKPVIGVHACARGKPGCPVCRYGFPI